jgi:hypothetical protein
MFILMRPSGEAIFLPWKREQKSPGAAFARDMHNPPISTESGAMPDRVRSLDELLGMLEEAARTNGYFEVGPDETQTLWAEFNRLRGSPSPRAEATLARSSWTRMDCAAGSVARLSRKLASPVSAVRKVTVKTSSAGR